jgi:tetratricopeptide (TPR) repeat protein
MNNNIIQRPLVLAAVLLIAAVASAQELNEDTYLEMAREGLQVGEYLAAAQNYVKAAELSDSADVAQQATRLAYSLGFDAEALTAAERWLELERDNAQALVFAARLQMRDGRLREARKNFRSFLKLGDGDEDEKLLALVQVLSEEDAEPAYDITTYLAKPYRKSANANYAVAIMALNAGDAATAIERLKTALEAEPDWLKAKLLYGRALLLDGQEQAAIDYTARIVGDSADPYPEARIDLALLYMSVGRNEDALSQVNQVILEQPGRADALRLMGLINFQMQNLDAASQDFEQLLATRRYTNDALFYLGRIADIRGELDKAIRLYAGVQSGSNAVAAQRRASALLAFEQEDPQAALALLDTFANNSPTNAVDVALAKAQLLTGLEFFDDALVYYNRYVEFRPDDEAGLLGRAQLLLNMERLDDALEQYAATVERFPESATALNAYGYTLADRTDQYDKAKALISKALEKEPDNPAIIDSIGWVRFRLGQNEQALADLERAYALFDDAEVAAHIVEVLHALGREDEAIERLEAAEEKDPDSEFLADVRSRLFPDSD